MFDEMVKGFTNFDKIAKELTKALLEDDEKEIIECLENFHKEACDDEDVINAYLEGIEDSINVLKDLFKRRYNEIERKE